MMPIRQFLPVLPLLVMITSFVSAMAVGFSIAAPVGPVGLLCIRRTLRHGMAYGLASGSGAAIADAMYGSIAAFGLTIISSALMRWTGWIELIGGFLLVLIGIYAMVRHKVSGPGDEDPGNMLRAFLSTLFLTLANPVTILVFVAIFSALGLARPGEDRVHASILVGGVFAGSFMWWTILSGLTHRMRHLLPDRVQKWTNLISGALLAGFGVAAFLRGLMSVA